MRIKRVGINNYRCLEDAEVEFSDITTIIGPNGAGKSSILPALDWFFNGTALSEDDVRAGVNPRQITVEVEFGELTEDDRSALEGNIAGDRAVIRRSWLDGHEDFQVFEYAYPMFADIRTGPAAMDKRNRYKTSVQRIQSSDYQAGRASISSVTGGVAVG